MIEKMKFVSITGPKADIDRVVNRYLSKYEIHLENALSELTTVRHLTPFLEINPYKDMLSTISSFYEELDTPEQIPEKDLTIEQALDIVSGLKSESDRIADRKCQLEEQRTSLTESMRIIAPFRNVEFDVSSILNFRHIHYRSDVLKKSIFTNSKSIFMKIWIRFLSNATKTTSISGASTLFRNARLPRSMQLMLPCILKKSLSRINIRVQQKKLTLPWIKPFTKMKLTWLMLMTR